MFSKLLAVSLAGLCIACAPRIEYGVGKKSLSDAVHDADRPESTAPGFVGTARPDHGSMSEPDPRALALLLGGRFVPAPPGSIAAILGSEIAEACPDATAPHGLFLVIDTTSSMVDALGELRHLDAALDAASRAGCRFALMLFRDLGDDYRLICFCPSDPPCSVPGSACEGLGATVDEVKAGLKKMEAKGGGDWPESTWQALSVAARIAAANVSPTRIVVVTDAPAKYDPPNEARARASLERGHNITLSFVGVGEAAKSGPPVAPTPRVESGARSAPSM